MGPHANLIAEGAKDRVSRRPAGCEPILFQKPGHLVRRLHQISTALFAEECAAFDLTPVQYAALVVIGRHVDIDATRLSSLIAFDRSTIGGVLDRVEAKGWVARDPSPDDRRIKLLRLTPDGNRLLARAESAIGRVQDRLLSPLAPADRATMMRLLADLTRMHDDIDGSLEGDDEIARVVKS